MQQPRVLSFSLTQNHRKYLSSQKVFPSEIWDWIIYTRLQNTGSSLLSSTIPALTDGSPGPFQSWGRGSSGIHSLLLKTGLSIYACPSRLSIISLKPVGLFQCQLFQPVSAGSIHSWQHQKSLGPYRYYTKLQQEERPKWTYHEEKTYSKFNPGTCGFQFGPYWAACGCGWPTSTWVAWTLSWSRSLGPWKSLEFCTDTYGTWRGKLEMLSGCLRL